jgi:predicted house-cleaning noncanonical NTP pyrophosphatase (MazG superfamily)
MLKSYGQILREGTLEIVKDKPVEEKAEALNIIEAIIEGDMSVEALVNAIEKGTVPKRYAPIKK